MNMYKHIDRICFRSLNKQIIKTEESKNEQITQQQTATEEKERMKTETRSVCLKRKGSLAGEQAHIRISLSPSLSHTLQRRTCTHLQQLKVRAKNEFVVGKIDGCTRAQIECE